MIPVGSSIAPSLVREHVTRLADLLKQQDWAGVVVFNPSNMLAFTGTPHSAWDRLSCGVVTREGTIHVICPAFERPAVAGAEGLATVHTWQEQEDPYRCLVAALAKAGLTSGRLGVDGRMWLDTFHNLQQAAKSLRVEPAEALLRQVRLCKSPAEQDVLRAAHQQGERLFLRLKELIRPGVTEIELYRQLAAEFAADGLAVDPMIQSGPNGAVPHNPTGQRRLKEGDTVVVDSVIQWEGYNNDLTRTYAVGEPPPKCKAAYQAVKRAQAAAIEAARPGIPCGRLDEIARGIIAEAGFGQYFIHRLGHGMGIECHEPPYLNGGNAELLQPGVCVTVEPGIYVQGEFGIRIEDDILITNDGCEVIRGQLVTDVSSAFS